MRGESYKGQKNESIHQGQHGRRALVKMLQILMCCVALPGHSSPISDKYFQF